MTPSKMRAFRAAFVVCVFGAFAAGSASAQRGAAAQPDYTKDEIATTKIASNFYTLTVKGPDFYPSEGDRPAGTIGVLTGPDGVFMVDAQFAPLTEKIVTAIKQISDGRIRFMVNTHVHGDHTGGNENLGKMGVTILSRDQLRERLLKPNPSPAAALPAMTYDQPVTFHMNGEDIHLIPVLRAHTDTDTVVQFPTVNVIMTGDIYRSDDNYPNIDRNNGGSLTGILDGLNAIIDLAGPDTKIIPGHGAVGNKSAVAAHRDMIMVVRTRVATLIQQGKTQDEVLAAKPTADFDGRDPKSMQNATRFVTQVYAELKEAK